MSEGAVGTIYYGKEWTLSCMTRKRNPLINVVIHKITERSDGVEEPIKLVNGFQENEDERYEQQSTKNDEHSIQRLAEAMQLHDH